MSIEERLDMERQYRDQESTSARLAGRLKSACCRQCGSVDGMQGVHRETLAELSATVITLTAPWYSIPGNDEYVFYVCPECNRDKTIPDGFMSVMTSILIWCYCAPEMAPDYDALAREEPVLASTDSRESAGL